MKTYLPCSLPAPSGASLALPEPGCFSCQPAHVCSPVIENLVSVFWRGVCPVTPVGITASPVKGGDWRGRLGPCPSWQLGLSWVCAEHDCGVGDVACAHPGAIGGGVCASRNEASRRQEVLWGRLCAVSGNRAAAGCRESAAGAPCSWRAYAVIK